MALDLLVSHEDPRLFIVMRGSKHREISKEEYSPVGKPFIVPWFRDQGAGTAIPQSLVASEISRQKSRYSDVEKATAYHAGDPTMGSQSFVAIQLYAFLRTYSLFEE